MIRYFHRLWAKFNGYFWLPCPVCGEHFGGHESSDNAVNYRRRRGCVHAELVCRKDSCSAEAKRQLEEFYKIEASECTKPS